MDLTNLVVILLSLAVLLISVILHEIAHGYVAYRFGDLTAKMDGRLTLNPLPHIDLFGTILLPLAFRLLGSPVIFGWAKPVPVNYHNLRGGEQAYFWVSLAGIAVNTALAIGGAIVYRLTVVSAFPGSGWLMVIAGYTVLYNVLLALFNLIPIPPLDGSRLLRTILPREGQAFLDQLEPYGFVFLFIFLYTFQDRLAASVAVFVQFLTGSRLFG